MELNRGISEESVAQEHQRAPESGRSAVKTRDIGGVRTKGATSARRLLGATRHL